MGPGHDVRAPSLRMEPTGQDPSSRLHILSLSRGSWWEALETAFSRPRPNKSFISRARKGIRAPVTTRIAHQSFLLLPRQTADQGHAHRPGSFLQLPLFLRKAFLNFLMPARNSDNKKRSLTLTREFGTFQHLFSFTLELGWVWPGLARGLTAAPGAGLNAFTRHILKPPPQPGLGSFWVRASHQPSAAPSSPKDAPSSLAPCHLSGAHHLLSHLDN